MTTDISAVIAAGPVMPAAAKMPSDRSMLRSDFGPMGGRPAMNGMTQRCRRSMARWVTAIARRSARRSPVISVPVSSPWMASSIRSSSSSLEETYQYSDMVPASSSRAMRRMVIECGPSASATATAVRTISSRDSERVRPGGRLPWSRRPCIRCWIRCSWAV